MDIIKAIKLTNGDGIIRQEGATGGIMIEGDDIIFVTGQHNMKTVCFAGLAKQILDSNWQLDEGRACQQ